MSDERRAYYRLKNLYPDAHWQRIENSVGVGCPDVNVCLKGKEVWIELKEGRVNKQGRVCIKVRPAQRAWVMRRLRSGGNVFLAVCLGKQVFLLPGACIVESAWEKEGIPTETIQTVSIPFVDLF